MPPASPPAASPGRPAAMHAWNLLGALKKQDFVELRRELDRTERACRHTPARRSGQQAEQMELLAAVADHLGVCAGNLEQGVPADGLDVDVALLAHLLRDRPYSCL